MKLRTRFLSIYAQPGAGWVRLFGFGVGWKDLRRHRMTFSERNGYKPHVEVGRWSFAWLT